MKNFNWTEYLYLAQSLTGKKTGGRVSKEAKRRTAISRAYYAVHRLAVESYKLQNVTFPKHTVHTDVINRLRLSKDATRTFIGNTLADLKIQRENADYRSFYKELHATYERSLDQAQKAVKRIEKLKKL